MLPAYLSRLNPSLAAAMLTLLIMAMSPAVAQDTTAAMPAEIAKTLPKAKLRGSAELRWLGFRIYDARLYTKDAKPFDWDAPFALELDYRRGFSRKQLVTATGKELTRLEGQQPDQAEILQKLKGCFNTVEKGDRFVAFGASNNRVDFLFNGRRTCKLQHDNIRQRILSIWLSDQARDPALSRQLRGK